MVKIERNQSPGRCLQEEAHLALKQPQNRHGCIFASGRPHTSIYMLLRAHLCSLTGGMSTVQLTDPWDPRADDYQDAYTNSGSKLAQPGATLYPTGTFYASPPPTSASLLGLLTEISGSHPIHLTINIALYTHSS